MTNTPGFVIPISYGSPEELQNDIQRRNSESGFVIFDPNEFGEETLDESLQMTTNVDDFLAHFGKKGMRWGVINEELPQGADKAAVAKEAKEERIRAKAAANLEKSQKFKTKSEQTAALIKELDDQGIQSPAMRKMYGKAVDHSDILFKVAYGTSKTKAVEKARNKQLKIKETADKDAIAKEQGRLTSNQKKAIVGGAVALGLVAGLAYMAYPDIVTRNAQPGNKISVGNFMRRYTNRSNNFILNPISKSAFDKMSDADVVIPKGTIFKRLTAFPDESLNNRLYTTFTDSDNMKYQGLYGAVLRQRTGNKNLFISSMEMGESIRSPSHKGRIQALVELLDEDSRDSKNPGLYRTMLQDTMPILDIFNPSDPRTMFGDNESNEQIALKAYNSFARNIVQNNALSEAYFDKIRSKGYNAIVDDNDAGQLSDVPMILLDAAKTVKNRTTSELTKDMEKQARTGLVEILDNKLYSKKK